MDIHKVNASNINFIFVPGVLSVYTIFLLIFEKISMNLTLYRSQCEPAENAKFSYNKEKLPSS